MRNLNDPSGTEWTRNARPAPSFSLDVAFELPNHVPNWLLPRGAPARPLPPPQGLTVRYGRVLAADAIGHEHRLASHFAQLPPMPPRRKREEAAEFRSLDVDVVVHVPGYRPLSADSFGPGHVAAADLLRRLSDPESRSSIAYDNLDQGWALRIMVECDDVFILGWDAEDEDPSALALRFPRRAMARQAAAARARLAHLMPILIAAAGRDLWQSALFRRASPT